VRPVVLPETLAVGQPDTPLDQQVCQSMAGRMALLQIFQSSESFGILGSTEKRWMVTRPQVLSEKDGVTRWTGFQLMGYPEVQ